MECAPLYPGAPEPRRAGGGNVAQRSRARCARVFRQHTDVLTKSPGARSRTRWVGCALVWEPGGPFFWLLLFGHAKRCNPAAGWPTEPAQDARDSVPDEDKRAIPACAGMTSKRKSKNWMTSPAVEERLPPALERRAKNGRRRASPESAAPAITRKPTLVPGTRERSTT